ncbi:MAG: DUF4249 domain-containing protein [Bacteroidota bacterium]
MKRIATILVLVFAAMIPMACVEEINVSEETFDSALVVDATITNQQQRHQIYLSRTYQFEDDGPAAETGAQVLVSGNGVTYRFDESEVPGVYVSSTEFAAQSGIDYTLQINTSDGSVYTSVAKQLTNNVGIENIYVQRENNDDDVNGMSIYIDSYNPGGDSQFYRYEYEETFKIVAPLWRDQDAIVIEGYPFCTVGLTERPEEQRICFRTETSNTTNLFTTANLSEDRVTRHLVHFVQSDDYKISHRYSLLARQYVHSQEVFEYLETLDSFIQEGSLFSQIQPGFVPGNISSETNPNQMVIGYFEVASVTEKRVFFNYVDFYPNDLLPPYISTCRIRSPGRFPEHQDKSEMCGPLIRAIERRTKVFLEVNEGSDFFPFQMVPRVCGDCTAIGRTNPPDFWVE